MGKIKITEEEAAVAVTPVAEAAAPVTPEEPTFTAAEATDIVTRWFRETFYNKALDTEFFNFNQAARDDLIKRFQRGK